MGNRKTLIVAAAVAAFVGFACQKEKPRHVRVTKKQLIEMNRRLAQRDSALIVAYSDSLGLNPEPDKSGLWMTRTHEGEGMAIEKSTQVELAYTISDLMGEVYYTSDRDGTKRMTAGMGQDVSGLDEALLQMRQGDKATLLLIPDKAYGMLGDENKIRGRRILRYDIEVLEAKK